MNQLFQDLRYGVRILLKKPGFTLVAVTTLALGIGANTAIFSVVNTVLLRPLPYEQPDRLVYLSERSPKFESMSLSYPDFDDWRTQNHVFEKIGVVNYRDYNLTGRGDAERLATGQISAGLFEALRARAEIGRLFTDDEDRPGAPDVAVLSHELWERRFNEDPEIIHQSITLNDRPYTVIGVLPREFAFSPRTALWVPVGPLSDKPGMKPRDNHPGLRGVARLKAGVTFEQAQAELNAIAARLEQQYPDTNKNIGARLDPLLEHYVHDVRRALLVILGAVGLVLLIACANVANLLLARAASRQREMAVRMALGAARWRLIRQLLAESVLLSVAGGVLGLLLAQWGVALILSVSKDAIPRVMEIGISRGVLLFTTALSVLTGIIFGLAPALHASRTDVSGSLKEISRSISGGRNRLRQSLIVAEVALTMMLLAGAGLLIRSFYQLQKVNTGFEQSKVLTFRVQLPVEKYPSVQQWLGFSQQMMARLRALPGVDDASVTGRVPMDQNDWQSGFRIVSQPPPPSGQTPSMEVSVVGPGYFRAMGIPLIRGRAFNEQDNRSALDPEKLRNLEIGPMLLAGLRSIIVDEDFARKYWPNEDPIGKQVQWPPDPALPPLTVVGVVAHVKLYSPSDPPGFVQGYFPFLELPDNGMSFVIKTSLDPEQIANAARQQLQAVDASLPMYDVQTLSQRVWTALSPQRFNSLLLGLFAGLALALATVGIYGVMSYTVTQRTHEIGLRIALGAESRAVLKLVVGQAMRLALSGVALGLIGAVALTRLMANLLFGVTPADPLTFALVVVVLASVSFIASWLPAMRATRVDPMVALRYE